MKPSVVLMKAAKLIECGSQRLSCLAIDEASRTSAKGYADAKLIFSELFEPPSRRGLVWFGQSKDPRNQDRRVIALCLAAAIAESEGK